VWCESEMVDAAAYEFAEVVTLNLISESLLYSGREMLNSNFFLSSIIEMKALIFSITKF